MCACPYVGNTHTHVECSWVHVHVHVHATLSCTVHVHNVHLIIHVRWKFIHAHKIVYINSHTATPQQRPGNTNSQKHWDSFLGSQQQPLALRAWERCRHPAWLPIQYWDLKSPLMVIPEAIRSTSVTFTHLICISFLSPSTTPPLVYTTNSEQVGMPPCYK